MGTNTIVQYIQNARLNAHGGGDGGVRRGARGVRHGGGRGAPKAKASRFGLRPSLSLASKRPGVGGQESVITRSMSAAHTQTGRPPEGGGHPVEAEDEQEDGELHAEPVQLVTDGLIK